MADSGTMSQDKISHGRGGAANIGPDHSSYTDGEIVREGPVGDQGDGAYSVGRGGKGNIGSPKVKPVHHGHDIDVVPETATRLVEQKSHHTGRGGEGNVHHTHEKEHPSDPLGLADKLKHKIISDKEDK